MKLIVIFLSSFFVTPVFSMVSSVNCPSEIHVDFSEIKKSEISEEIQKNVFLQMFWEKMIPSERYTETFKILTRSESTLCVYVGNAKVAYLQTNNFEDELMVTYDREQNSYFRLKITSFSPNHIELSKQNLKLLSPILEAGGDSVTQIGEGQIGEAASVKLSVLP